MTFTIKPTRVRLKNLQVADFASEETLCFSAIVLLDGRPVAQARNDGHGGCTFLHPLKGAQAGLAEAEAFAKSLPAVVTEYDDPHDPSRKFTIEVTLDYLVDHLVQQMHEDRKTRAAFKRDFSNKLLFIKDQRLLFLKGVKLKTVPDRASLYADLRAKHGAGLIILNELPSEEAFALWKQHVVAGDPS